MKCKRGPLERGGDAVSAPEVRPSWHLWRLNADYVLPAFGASSFSALCGAREWFRVGWTLHQLLECQGCLLPFWPPSARPSLPHPSTISFQTRRLFSRISFWFVSLNIIITIMTFIKGRLIIIVIWGIAGVFVVVISILQGAAAPAAENKNVTLCMRVVWQCRELAAWLQGNTTWRGHKWATSGYYWSASQ